MSEPDEYPDCERCGAGEDDQRTEKSFGGFWKRICVKCGFTIASGREKPPED